MKINKYGLQWTVDASNPNRVVLKQGNGFTFLGKLSIHPVWGAYIYIHSVCGFVNANNVYEKKEYFLFIDNSIYEQLPEQWTIDDIYNADKDYQDKFRQISEQLWYNIAEARQSGQPIVIFVEEECLSIGSIRCIYTEQKTPYGMTLPIIIPYKEGRGYI